MTEARLIPARHIETELIDLNSRFITNAGPVFTVDEAQRFIRGIKEKYPDATHHVPVYLIGHGSATTAHCSDDGEPSGTAGRPALAVLRGSGLGDIALVITRYYGGANLGAGGLVRAYSDSVRQALAALPRAKKVATTLLMFVLPYALFEQALLMTASHNGVVTDKSFAADVTLSVRVPDVHLEAFKDRMIALTHGEIEFILIEQRDNTIMPL